MSFSDPTFRNYISTQAASYAAARRSYASALYEGIIGYHERTGGYLDKLLDVGCGPGNSTRDLAPKFKRALGVDPGEQMIVNARGQGGMTATGEEIQYAVVGAENLLDVSGIEEASVDLVTAAMAVCTFRLTPERIGSTWMPSGEMSPAVRCFPPNLYVRREWDVDGVFSDGHEFFGGSDENALSSLESSLGTASMVTRWREANPEKVGTDDDCVRVTMARVREAMGIGKGEDAMIKTGAATALLMFKKM